MLYTYLTASTEWVKNNKKTFGLLLEVLSDFGYSNTNEYISSLLNGVPNPDDNKKNFHLRTIKRIKKAQLLIADISDPSVTIGALIEYAVSNNIPVLCLCNEAFKKDIPSLMKYYDAKLFTLALYNPENLENLLKNYFETFKKGKVKFNVFIPLEMDSYMKWYSRKYHIAKSDFVRDLILEKIKTDKEYNEILPENVKKE